MLNTKHMINRIPGLSKEFHTIYFISLKSVLHISQTAAPKSIFHEEKALFHANCINNLSCTCCSYFSDAVFVFRPISQLQNKVAMDISLELF